MNKNFSMYYNDMILEIAQKLTFNHHIKYIKISKSYTIHVIQQLDMR